MMRNRPRSSHNPTRTVPGRLRAAAALSTVLLLLQLAASPHAGADHVEEPDPVAQNAFVGDVLRGVGLGALGALFERAADSPEGMASTTKTWTILLAVEAIGAGEVTVDTPVTISANALSINQKHSHGSICTDGGTSPSCPGAQALEVGDQFRLEDALLMLFIRSPGDLTVAVAEAIAGSEAAFVQRMNDRADAIGLDQTQFFNPYGGDHGHDGDGDSSGIVAHESTPREMARWFIHAMQNPLFREILGFRGTHTFSNLAGTKSYSFGFNPGYPGAQARKGGSNSECGICLLIQAERIGREMVVAFQRSISGSGDDTLLLDYGFADLFHPREMAVASPWGPVDDASVSCLSPGRTATAVVTPAGAHRMLVWYQNLDAGGLALLGSTPEPTGDQLGTGTARGVEQADAGGGNVIVAVDRTDRQVLVAYGVTPQGQPFVRDTVDVGTGSDIAVEVLAPNVLLTAHRSPGGTLMLSTWGFDPATGDISDAPLDSDSVVPVSEFALAGRPQVLLDMHAVVAYRRTNGFVNVRGWSVAPSGALTDAASVVMGQGEHLSLTRATGFEPADDLYALAFRSAQSDAQVRVLRFGFDNSLAVVGTSGGTGIEVGSQGATAVASYDARGVLVASKEHQASPTTDLTSWSIDPVFDGTEPNQINAWNANLVVQDTTGPADTLFDMCAVPDDRAEGDFVLAQQNFFNFELRPEGWRSGPRAPQEADLEHMGVMLENPPETIPVNTPVELVVKHTLRNNGPTAPVQARLDTLVTAPPDCDVQSQLTNQHLSVLGSGIRIVDTRVQLTCSQPSFHPIDVQAWVAPLPGVIDPALADNSSSTSETIEVLAHADLAVPDLDLQTLDDAGLDDLLVDKLFAFHAPLTVHNFGDTEDGLYTDPVDAGVRRTIEVPEGLSAFVRVVPEEAPASIRVEKDGFPVVAIDQPAGTATEVEGPVRITVGFGLADLEVGADRVLQGMFGLRCLAPGSHAVRFQARIAPLDEHVIDPEPANDVLTTGRTIECVTPVQINIRPGNDNNFVNTNGNQAVPVGILTTAAGEYGLPLDVDAVSVQHGTVRFGVLETLEGGGGASPSPDKAFIKDSFEMDDQSKDGDLDMELRFKAAGTGIDGDATEACVTGIYLGEGDVPLPFFGCDTVQTLP